jgi:type I restriction enzyme S subunit
MLREGDVLMTEGGDIDKLGRGALWNGEIADCLHQNHIFAVRCKHGLDAQYFEIVLRTPYAKTYFITTAKQTTNLASTNRSKIGNFKVPLPPLDEQRVIVKYIRHIEHEVGAAIRSKRKLIALLREQKAAVLHELLASGEDSWPMWRIGRLAKVGNGSTPSRSKLEFWSPGTYPWLNSSQVNRGTIDSADQFVTKRALRDCHLPRIAPGSVLVAITGQGKTRGMSALLNIEATVNQHLAYITPQNHEVSADWIHLTLSAAYSDLRRISDDSGSTKGALTCGDLKRYRIPVPPTVVQQELIARAAYTTAVLDGAITATEREIALLHEYLTKLTSDVVAEKLDVREAAAALPDDDLATAAQAADFEDSDPEGLDDEDEPDDGEA